MKIAQGAQERPNHGEHTETVPGSRTPTNPAAALVVRRPDQTSETRAKPGTRGQTDAKLTPSDLTRMARADSQGAP
jgi:hypothetical protein